VGKGRPKGKATVKFLLRLRPDQKRDLDIVSGASDGAPPINGLISTAVDRYLAQKLLEPQVHAAHERTVKPYLRVVGPQDG